MVFDFVPANHPVHVGQVYFGLPANIRMDSQSITFESPGERHSTEKKGIGLSVFTLREINQGTDTQVYYRLGTEKPIINLWDRCEKWIPA